MQSGSAAEPYLEAPEVGAEDEGEQHGDGREVERLGSGRTVASETEAPSMLANLV